MYGGCRFLLRVYLKMPYGHRTGAVRGGGLSRPDAYAAATRINRESAHTARIDRDGTRTARIDETDSELAGADAADSTHTRRPD